jgi:GT2 family glycosyltransferase
MPKLSVGILTYNRRDLVLKALVSVIEQGLTDVEIVVVDSASSDGTADTIATHYPAIKLIRLPRNLGCPGGRNHIYANCSGDYIVNLDDDGCLCEGTLRGVVEIFDAYPDIGVISMRRVETTEEITKGGAREKLTDVGSFSGGLSAFRREMLNKVGYYPENFFLTAEEAHLALRIIDAGYRIVYAHDLLMQHPAEAVNSGDSKWDFYRFRNPLLVVLELFPTFLCSKYMLLRLGSSFVASISRGTIVQYFLALADILVQWPKIMRRRKPVSPNTVHKYFWLRGKRVTMSNTVAIPDPRFQQRDTL